MQKSKLLNDKKIAIVVEELTQLGGAERIFDALLEIFPKAPVFTLVWDKEKTHHRYDKVDIRTSIIQKLPFGIKKYKWYLVLMPKAVESFNLKEFNVVISITSALVKGVKTNSDQLHICYCNTPTRYLWTDSDEYIKNAPIPFFVRPLMPWIINRLRKWDLLAASRPDFFIANSKNVQERIEKYYHRNSDVIYPNVSTEKYTKAVEKKENYFLLVSRLEPYKKVDLVIDAFRALNENLVVVGSGTIMKKIQSTAPKNVKFLGRVNDDHLAKTYAKAKAMIFPQDEDFGITPVEAMAAGTPVIAYKRGGAMETIVASKTGEFFYPQTSSALIDVIKNFHLEKYHRKDLITQAKKFDQAIFKEKILEYIIDKSKIKSQKSNI